MTTAVLTVTDLVQSIGSVAENGGVVEATLEDGSDATNLGLTRSATTDARAAMSLDTFTLGTGRLKSWFVSYRRAWGSGVQPPLRVYLSTFTVPGIDFVAQILDFPPTAYATVNTSPQVPPNATQAQLDDLTLTFWIEAGTAGAMSVSEASVSVTYAVAPVANITYPTGSPTLTLTSTPTVTWTHSAGSDGGPQTAYQLKAFTAAQYGAGGFSPDTSTAAYDSAVVTSSAQAAAVGPLANSTTFKVYLRTAQTINGALHWSAWDNEIVSTNFTPATVSTVTTSAVPASGYIQVTANHSGAAWVDVEIERSDDGGVTWVPVRGATKVTTATGNNHVTSWSSSAVVVRDHEAPNGVMVTYRARASTALITGAYTSATPTSWSESLAVWLKDPNDPTLNVKVLVQEQPQPSRAVAQGVFQPIGAAFPVVISDRRSSRVGTFVCQTQSLGQGLLLEAAIENQVKLLQFPAVHLWGSKYIALGPAQEMYLDPAVDIFYRQWQIAYSQIDRPADETNY